MFSWFQLSGVSSLLRLGKSYLRPTADNHAVPKKYLDLTEKWSRLQEYITYCEDMNQFTLSLAGGSVVNHRRKDILKSVVELVLKTGATAKQKATARIEGLSLDGSFIMKYRFRTNALIGVGEFFCVGMGEGFTRTGFTGTSIFFGLILGGEDFDGNALNANEVYFCCREGSTSSVVSSGITFEANQIYEFEISYTPEKVSFFLWKTGDEKPVTPIDITTNIVQDSNAVEIDTGFGVWREIGGGTEIKRCYLSQLGYQYLT